MVPLLLPTWLIGSYWQLWFGESVPLVLIPGSGLMITAIEAD